MENIKTRNGKYNSIFIIFICALLLRLAMLCLFSIYEYKFGSFLYIDDWKYRNYAIIYNNIRTGLVDVTAMNTAGKMIGGIKVAKFFFRYNAILYSIFESTLILRLSNIIFSSLTIFPIYHLTKMIGNSKAAKISAWIFAFLPYHIIMSVFIFKDILMAFLFISALYYVFDYWVNGVLNWKMLILVLLPLPGIRDGLTLFIVGMLALLTFIKVYLRYPKYKKIFWITIPLLSIIMMYVFRDTLMLLLTRIDYYMMNGRNGGGGITFIRIDGLKQLYKLPLTWGFSTILPIATTFKLENWSDFLMIANYTMLFITPAYIIYILFIKKTKSEIYFFIPLLALHLLIIILVINIPRHYYFLNFYMIIGASIFISKFKNKKQERLYIILCLLEICCFIFASIVLL